MLFSSKTEGILCKENSTYVTTEKSFRNFIKSNQNQIVFTVHQLIWIQTEVHLFANQSENDRYNLILVVRAVRQVVVEFPKGLQDKSIFSEKNSAT